MPILHIGEEKNMQRIPLGRIGKEVQLATVMSTVILENLSTKIVKTF